MIKYQVNLLFNHTNNLTYEFNYDNVNKEVETPRSRLDMAKKQEEQSVVESFPIEAKPDLNKFGFVMFKGDDNTWYTAKVNFDAKLTTAEFSDKQRAGDERALAVEQMKIKLGATNFGV